MQIRGYKRTANRGARRDWPGRSHAPASPRYIFKGYYPVRLGTSQCEYCDGIAIRSWPRLNATKHIMCAAQWMYFGIPPPLIFFLSVFSRKSSLPRITAAFLAANGVMRFDRTEKLRRKSSRWQWDWGADILVGLCAGNYDNYAYYYCGVWLFLSCVCKLKIIRCKFKEVWTSCMGWEVCIEIITGNGEISILEIMRKDLVNFNGHWFIIHC